MKNNFKKPFSLLLVAASYFYGANGLLATSTSNDNEHLATINNNHKECCDKIEEFNELKTKHEKTYYPRVDGKKCLELRYSKEEKQIQTEKIEEIKNFIINKECTYTPDNMGAILLKALNIKGIEISNFLLSRKKVNINYCCPKSGETILTYAVFNAMHRKQYYGEDEFMDIVEKILKINSIDVSVENGKGKTALFIAVLENAKQVDGCSGKIINLLLSKEVDISPTLSSIEKYKKGYYKVSYDKRKTQQLKEIREKECERVNETLNRCISNYKKAQPKAQAQEIAEIKKRKSNPAYVRITNSLDNFFSLCSDGGEEDESSSGSDEVEEDESLSDSKQQEVDTEKAQSAESNINIDIFNNNQLAEYALSENDKVKKRRSKSGNGTVSSHTHQSAEHALSENDKGKKSSLKSGNDTVSSQFDVGYDASSENENISLKNKNSSKKNKKSSLKPRNDTFSSYTHQSAYHSSSEEENRRLKRRERRKKMEKRRFQSRNGTFPVDTHQSVGNESSSDSKQQEAAPKKAHSTANNINLDSFNNNNHTGSRKGTFPVDTYQSVGNESSSDSNEQEAAHKKVFSTANNINLDSLINNSESESFSDPVLSDPALDDNDASSEHENLKQNRSLKNNAQENTILEIESRASSSDSDSNQSVGHDSSSDTDSNQSAEHASSDSDRDEREQDEHNQEQNDRQLRETLEEHFKERVLKIKLAKVLKINPDVDKANVEKQKLLNGKKNAGSIRKRTLFSCLLGIISIVCTARWAYQITATTQNTLENSKTKGQIRKQRFKTNEFIINSLNPNQFCSEANTFLVGNEETEVINQTGILSNQNCKNRINELEEAANQYPCTENFKLMEELRTTKENLEATKENLEATQENLKATKENLEATKENLEATQENLKATKENLEATQEKKDGLAKELKVTQEEKDGLAKVLKVTQEEKDGLAKELKVTQEEKDGLAKVLKATEKKLNNTNGELTKEKKLTEALKRGLDEKKQGLKSLQAEIKEKIKELKTYQYILTAMTMATMALLAISHYKKDRVLASLNSEKSKETILGSKKEESNNQSTDNKSLTIELEKSKQTNKNQKKEIKKLNLQLTNMQDSISNTSSKEVDSLKAQAELDKKELMAIARVNEKIKAQAELYDKKLMTIAREKEKIKAQAELYKKKNSELIAATVSHKVQPKQKNQENNNSPNEQKSYLSNNVFFIFVGFISSILIYLIVDLDKARLLKGDL